MKKESREFRRMNDGSIWVFIEGRGWTFLEVHRQREDRTERPGWQRRSARM